MRQNSYNVVFFVLLTGATVALWWYANQNWFPKADQPQKDADQAQKDGPPARPNGDALAAVAGAAAGLPAGPAAPPAPPKAEAPPTPPAKVEPPVLARLGNGNFYLDVLLSDRGGGVQQVVLPKFNEADRLGTEAKVDGQPAPLALIPGVRASRGGGLRAPYVPPGLAPGPVTDPDTLARLAPPSYTLFHYPTPDDKYPSELLGTVKWKVVAHDTPDDGNPHTLVYETDALAGAPHFVKIKKVFTLGPKDYHVGLELKFERLKDPAAAKGKGQLRYQISGPRGLPVEGEWYTSTTRTCLIGWLNPKGTARRQYEDAATITAWRGGEAVPKADGTFQYAAVATQFFSSGLAIPAPANDPGRPKWASVRGTSELPFPLSQDEVKRLEAEAKNGADPLAAAAAAARLAADRAAQAPPLPEMADITFRAVCEPLDLAPGEAVAHQYDVYNGPTKVRLLGLLEGDRAVAPELVTRYLDADGLRTLTDYQSPTWIGSFANAIYWTDLVIVFTNIMHGLLWAIHNVVGSWGFSIIVLTVMVRLLLFIPSRKQTAMNMRMVEVQKRLKPELDKLHEKYKDDFQTYNREKTRLMMQHGLNPFAAMGGCLLLLAQSPMIMGLYFCLQESIFFRLEPFLWFDNLAAPDMTLWWGEGIPVISDPENRRGTLAFLYLGPFLNILPLIAVGLMLYQQHKMMPPATDEQTAQQQRMMKIMMGVMAVMFYKVAAGLALYFIIGTTWSIIERQFIPKPKLKEEDLTGPGGKGGAGGPPRPKGRLGRLLEGLKEKVQEAQRQAEEQASRQLKNNRNGQPPADRDGNGPPPDRRNRDKKKRRK